MPIVAFPKDGRKKDEDTSFLVKETQSMARRRREMEQHGLRALLKQRVHGREHRIDTPETASLMNDANYGEGVEQHPLLESQLFDGIDNNPSDPRLDPEAKRKIENKKREQKLEKQLRLENRLENELTYSHSPRFNPKPGGP